MTTIDYEIPLIKQGWQDCVQTNTIQILKYYGIEKSIEEIKNEVPVYINSEGKAIGSSLGHIASYFINQGLKTIIHTVDIEIFDRSWKGLNKTGLVEKLKERRKYFVSAKYEDEALDLIFDGYIKFAETGGEIEYPIIDENYLVELLKNGPVFGVVSYNFLNNTSKYKFSDDKASKDDVQGLTGTHVVTIAGFKDGKFKLVDPDLEFGGNRWVESALLIGSIYLAETDYDAMVVSFER